MSFAPAGPPVRTLRFTHAPARLLKLGAVPAKRLPVKPAPLPRALPATPTVARAPAPRPTPMRRGLLGWLASNKLLASALVLLLLASGVGVALVVIQQPLVATPTAGSSPVCFASGDDVTALDGLGLVDTPDIVTGCGSASITVYGIPGASALSLGEVLELGNADTADNVAFDVGLSVSGSPASSLDGFTLTFVDDVAGVPTTRTWDLLGTPTLTTYRLSDGETWEFTVSSLLMDATATGSQGALTITATITQV